MQKDDIRTLKILQSVSEFDGLSKQQNNPAYTKSVSLHNVEVGHCTKEEEEEEPCSRTGHSLSLIIMSTRHQRTLSSTSSSSKGFGDDGGSEEGHRKEEMGMFGDTGNGRKFSFRAMMSK